MTTFDQFLLSLLGDRARHQMRFHNLADSIIVFDEVQALPTQLWDIVRHSLTQLTEHLNSTAILMSATQPGFLEEAEKPDPRSKGPTTTRSVATGSYSSIVSPCYWTTLFESVLDRREELVKSVCSLRSTLEQAPVMSGTLWQEHGTRRFTS